MSKLKAFSRSLVICYIMIVILLFITSSIFAYTTINDKYLDMFVLGVVFLSVFINSIILNKKIKERGVIYGTLFGLIVIFIIYFIGLTFFGFSFSQSTIIYAAISILSGLVGGIIGVNV